MGARTPDAYRIGAGQVTQEYPADAVPARLRKQPSLPTMSRAPESSPVEQVVTAEVAVVRRDASVPPRQSKESRPSKDAAASTQCNVVARDAVHAQEVPAVESPAREYAHLDECPRRHCPCQHRLKRPLESAARRVPSARHDARVSLPRAWIAVSVPLAEGSDTMAS